MWVYLFLKKEFRLLNKNIEKVVNFSNADPLTHLPNRILFCEHFNHLSEAARLNPEKLAVLFLDIDHFNMIKDAWGFGVSDDLYYPEIIHILKHLKTDSFSTSSV
jgi:diguanylate cyclase (GGDEF)-like protein